MRTALSASLAAGAAARLDAVDYSKPVPEAEKLTAYLNGAQIVVRWNNKHLCAYRAHPTQKYPYFFPLAGPWSGNSTVAESSLPYPHHRGLWLGCEPLNGGDYWGDGPLDQGQIRSAGLELEQATQHSAVIADRCEWVRKGALSPLEDERKFAIRIVSDRLWLIDADLKLTARDHLAIKQAKHSFFAVRAAADISPIYGGSLVNSEGGAGAKDTFGKPARWCAFYGQRRVWGKPVEGIAVMDHPENPWAPCPWFTRDYGHFSPSPFSFRKKPWELEKGESIRLRYRVVVFGGSPKDAGLEGLYNLWTTG